MGTENIQGWAGNDSTNTTQTNIESSIKLSTYVRVAHMTLHVVRSPAWGLSRWILYTILHGKRYLNITNAATMSDRPTERAWFCLMNLVAWLLFQQRALRTYEHHYCLAFTLAKYNLSVSIYWANKNWSQVQIWTIKRGQCWMGSCL